MIKRYILNTLIVSVVIGVCYTPIHWFVTKKANLWDIPYEIACFAIAIVFVDSIKGQKVFARN